MTDDVRRWKDSPATGPATDHPAGPLDVDPTGGLEPGSQGFATYGCCDTSTYCGTVRCP